MTEERNRKPSFEEVQKIALGGLASATEDYFKYETGGFRDKHRELLVMEEVESNHNFAMILGVNMKEVIRTYLTAMPSYKRVDYFKTISELPLLKQDEILELGQEFGL